MLRPTESKHEKQSSDLLTLLMKQICFMESLVFYINPLPPPYTSCYITWNYSDNDFIFFSSILLYVHVSTPMHVMLRENNRESWTKWFNPFSSTFTSSINPHLSCLCTWCMLKENKMEPWTKPFSSCTCVFTNSHSCMLREKLQKILLP